ncbi:MAG: DUF1667 domain-containing protein [Emergencia sp.]
MNKKIEKDLICIVCPNGCRLHGTVSEDGTLTVEGNRCVRGEAFAGTEMTSPVRSLTTTVRTSFDNMPWLPVRTDGEIPKYAVPDALKELRGLRVNRKVLCGDCVLENLAGTGIPVIATADLQPDPAD